MLDPWRFASLSARYWLQLSETMLFSSLTIAARSALMSQALLSGRPWPMAEMMRMVSEKQEAALASAVSALTPYSRATRANAKRLSRRRA